MSKVKRELHIFNDGRKDYAVRAADYDTLAAENQRLQAEPDRLELLIKQYARRLVQAEQELAALKGEQVKQEPVAYGDPKALKNMRIDGHKGSPYNREWMWSKPDAGLIPLYTHPAPQQPGQEVEGLIEVLDDAAEEFELRGLHHLPAYKRIKELHSALAAHDKQTR